MHSDYVNTEIGYVLYYSYLYEYIMIMWSHR
jgi:hypothetical protein